MNLPAIALLALSVNCCNQTTPNIYGLANLAETRVQDLEVAGVIDTAEASADYAYCEKIKAIVTDRGSSIMTHSQAHWIIQHQLGVMNERLYGAFLISAAPLQIVLEGIEIDPTGAANLPPIKT